MLNSINKIFGIDNNIPDELKHIKISNINKNGFSIYMNGCLELYASFDHENIVFYKPQSMSVKKNFRLSEEKKIREFIDEIWIQNYVNQK